MPQTVQTVQLFIKNKDEDFIAELTVPDGTANAASLPAKLVLTGFSRDAPLLSAKADPSRPGLAPTLLELRCENGKQNEVKKFRGFLCERKKAATANGGAGAPLVVVLPRPNTATAAGSAAETLSVVMYCPAAAPAAAAAPAKKAPSWAPKPAATSPRKLPSWGAKRTSSTAGASGGASAPPAQKRRLATMAEKVALGSQQYRDLGPDETLQLPQAIGWDTDRMVLKDPVSGRCVYYQDKGKKYRFITDARKHTAAVPTTT